jgi:hypothetical protein
LGLTIVAMPAYNEEHSIARMVRGCKKHALRRSGNEGSSDRTVDAEFGALTSSTLRTELWRSCCKPLWTARSLGATEMVIIDRTGSTPR